MATLPPSEHPAGAAFSIDNETDEVPSPGGPVTTPPITGDHVAYVPIDDRINAGLAHAQGAEEAAPTALEALQRQGGKVAQALKDTASALSDKISSYVEAHQSTPGPEVRTVAPLAGPAPAANDAQTARSKFLAAAADLGKKSRENASWVVHATAEGFKRLTTPKRTLTAICKQEAASRPIPQSVLVLLTAIVSAGLSTKGLFQDDGDAGAAAHLIESGHLLLPPSDASPLVLAAAVKHFLATLAEPLLLTRLADRWIAATGDVADIKVLLTELPAANAATLRLLLETCRRIVLQSRTGGEDAQVLAAALAPVLLWRMVDHQRSAPRQPKLATAIGANFSVLRAKFGGVMSGSSADATAMHAAEVLVDGGSLPHLSHAAAEHSEVATLVPPGMGASIDSVVAAQAGPFTHPAVAAAPLFENTVDNSLVNAVVDEEDVSGLRMALVGAELTAIVQVVQQLIEGTIDWPV